MQRSDAVVVALAVHFVAEYPIPIDALLGLGRLQNQAVAIEQSLNELALIRLSGPDLRVSENLGLAHGAALPRRQFDGGSVELAAHSLIHVLGGVCRRKAGEM